MNSLVLDGGNNLKTNNLPGHNLTYVVRGSIAEAMAHARKCARAGNTSSVISSGAMQPLDRNGLWPDGEGVWDNLDEQ